MILRIRLPVGPAALARRLRLPLLRALCVLCFVGGLACLALYADIYFDARAFQRQSLAQLSAAAADSAGPGAKPRPAPARGDLLGKLEIPRLKLSIAILSGTDEPTLLRGIGHIEHTTAPGEVGNVGIAGHRDTFFRPLKDIRVRDEIVVTAPETARVYLVSETMIVDPEDVFVLAPEVGDALTLVTCYPFYYVGKAPRRFIVRALPKMTGGEREISGDGGGG